MLDIAGRYNGQGANGGPVSSMEISISSGHRNIPSDPCTSLFDQLNNPVSTQGGLEQPGSTASSASLYLDSVNPHGRADRHGDQDIDPDFFVPFGTDLSHLSFDNNTSFNSPFALTEDEFNQFIGSMPGLNTPADEGSIMVASDDPVRCLDETNQSETTSIEEAPASVPNAPAKKPKAVRAGSGQKLRRAPKRGLELDDAHNNTGHIKNPGKRCRTDPTLERLDKRTQNGEITASQEVTAGSPTSELPFRPEDLAGLISTVEDSPLNGDFLDTIVPHFVACNPHVTTITGSAWTAAMPGENTLPCNNPSIFILRVDIKGHPACLIIHVAEREAMLFTSTQDKDDQEKWQEFASRFVSNCLPEPYNNWDDRWTTQLDPSLQQCGTRDSGIYYIWVTMHIALGLKLPLSFDSRLVRSFIYAVCTIINHLADAAVAPGSGSTEATPGAANRNSNTLQTLWEVFSSTELIQGYKHEALPKAFEAIQNAVGAAPFADNDSCREFLQKMVASYKETRVHELEQLEALAEHLVLLTDAFCASSTVGLGDQNELDNDEAGLRRIEKDATSLQRTHLDVKDMVEQQLRYIAEQERKCTKSRWFQEALRLVDGPGTTKCVKELKRHIKEAPLQAECEAS
ncbi:hypothetical protein F5883DRAFT_652362 [Diaporthe sp. PMI_573]|nr:hypothetical protein F5883DRAFT_652362 [Diaporthaceae sp. PMI_573]